MVTAPANLQLDKPALYTTSKQKTVCVGFTTKQNEQFLKNYPFLYFLSILLKLMDKFQKYSKSSSLKFDIKTFMNKFNPKKIPKNFQHW